MRGEIIIFSIATALSNAVYAGDVFRCVAVNGDVMFTNMGCPTNSQLVQHVASYEPVPDSPAPTYEATAKASAISALEAREAAQQARAAAAAAAYQAQVVYEKAQAEAQNEQSYDGTVHVAWWIPSYPLFGSRFHHHHHNARQAMVAPSALHSQLHAMPTPHAHDAVFAPHH